MELQFDGKGSEHQTLAGGVVSFLIKLILLMYGIRLVMRIFDHSDDSNETI